jgi:hypothetical protein
MLAAPGQSATEFVADWVLFCRAWIELVAAGRALRRNGVGETIGALGGSSGVGGFRDGDESQLAAGRLVTERIAAAVRRAARITYPYPTCLVRSIALARMLARKGFPAEVRFGVRPPVDGVLAAHAWVEVDGRVVGDRADIGSEFQPLLPAERVSSLSVTWLDLPQEKLSSAQSTDASVSPEHS